MFAHIISCIAQVTLGSSFLLAYMIVKKEEKKEKGFHTCPNVWVITISFDSVLSDFILSMRTSTCGEGR